MTSAKARSAEMFNMLAVLHLNGLAVGQRGAMPPQLGPVLEKLQDLSKEGWTEFLAFAELQRVSLRTLQLLKCMTKSGAITPKFDGLGELEQVQQRQIQNALATLSQVVEGLQQTGHSPIVIKTLDHWPDIGSDLDLFHLCQRGRYGARHEE